MARATPTFTEKMRIHNFLSGVVVIRDEDADKAPKDRHITYDGDWNDAKIAEHMDFHCTPWVIRNIRQEMFGKLRVSGGRRSSITRRIDGLEMKVSDLTKRIEELESLKLPLK